MSRRSSIFTLSWYRFLTTTSIAILTYECLTKPAYAPYSMVLFAFALATEIALCIYERPQVSGKTKVLNKDDITALYTLALYTLALCALALCALAVHKLLLYALILCALILSVIAPHAGITQYRTKIRQSSKAFRKIAKYDDSPMYALCLFGLCLYVPAAYLLPLHKFWHYGLAVLALTFYAAKVEAEVGAKLDAELEAERRAESEAAFEAAIKAALEDEDEQ